ncbi:unnamed protein product [Cyprideis torosa]|uniref:Peptidase M14 domain-containing protein n=1 Tax=Cyprideis torosa TaxID=163714 RepID=A0A7R8W3N3_9CRUS|nr:unnamed protein product [Cyprideis torosa]CAG0883042.1 unnamed protein product [Cyprideis torosa]
MGKDGGGDSGSDSDAENTLGNVMRMVMRPPGHSGKAKRGHLCLDASYEGGNLGRVDFITEYEYDLFIRPDTCNPRFRVWFNFVVDNCRVDQRVIFNIVNFSKTKLLFREGMTPLVKSTSRPKWYRIPARFTYYHKSPEHKQHYLLSFAFAFDKEDEVYQFAFAYPYSYSRLQAHLEQICRKNFSFFQRDLLAQSVQQRRCDLLTITNPNNLTDPNRQQRVVVIMARSHAGDTPTSYVIQGLLDFLCSSHPIAVTLREHIIFKVIPMLNPDGVFYGNHKTNIMGMDLNRQWHEPSEWAHPTVFAAKNFIQDLDEDKNVDLDFVLDLHANSSLVGTFIYGNSYDDVYRYERHIVFPKMLSQVAEDYNPNNCLYNRDIQKQHCARRVLCDKLKDSVNCYSLEVSFYGYQLEGNPTTIPYTEEGYMRLGRNLARAFLEYYKFMNMIPLSTSNATSGGTTSTTGERGRVAPRGEKTPRFRKSHENSVSSNHSKDSRHASLSRRAPRIEHDPEVHWVSRGKAKRAFKLTRDVTGAIRRMQRRGSYDSAIQASEFCSYTETDGEVATTRDPSTGNTLSFSFPIDDSNMTTFSQPSTGNRLPFSCHSLNLNAHFPMRGRSNSLDRLFPTENELWRKYYGEPGTLISPLRGFPAPRGMKAGMISTDAYSLALAREKVKNPKTLKIVDMNQMTQCALDQALMIGQKSGMY